MSEEERQNPEHRFGDLIQKTAPTDGSDADGLFSLNEKTPLTDNLCEEAEPPPKNRGTNGNRQFSPPNRKEQKGKKQTAMRWVKTLLLLALIVISVFLLFSLPTYISGAETKKFSDMLDGVNWIYFGVLLCAVLVQLSAESSKYAYLLKISTGKFRFRTSVKTMFLGKYYNAITPFSTGGQPFQIYYLHKKNIPKGAATSIPLVHYIVYAMVISVISAVLLVMTPYYVRNGTLTTTMLILSWISLFINCLVPVVIVLFTLFPKTTRRIIALIIKILCKLHIVKHKYPVMKKWLRELNEYSASVKAFIKHLKQTIPLTLLCILETTINYSLPFFAVLAIANVPPTAELYVQILCLSVITRYTALLIPTPGNTGAVEMTGSLIFITIAGIEPVLGWVVLVWRFITYYSYIAAGIGFNLFDLIRETVRNRKKKRVFL